MKNKRIWTKLATVLLLGSLVACQPGKRRSEMGSKNLKLLFPQIYESKEKEIKVLDARFLDLNLSDHKPYEVILDIK